MHNTAERYSHNDGEGYYVGLQTNLKRLSLSQETMARLSYPTNNLGDCYQPEKCLLPNTMAQERLAVERMAAWLGLPADETWGYVGGGSSFGNLQGMWMGATILPDATLVFTESAHYSIHKFATCLRFKKVKVIKSHLNGEIDLEDFERQIEQGERVVIVLTAGTTMTSAYDPVARCTAVLEQYRCDYYLHMDAALGGLIVPFIDSAILPTRDDYTFRNPAVSSTTISMHKVLGAPMPANVFIARQCVVSRFKEMVNRIPYFNDLEDITVYGSRDGFRAALIYEQLLNVTPQQLEALVSTNAQQAQQLAAGLRAVGLDSTFAQPGGLAVVIPLASLDRMLTAQQQDMLQRKYRLVSSKQVLHLYVMGHVTSAMCREFLEDCRAMVRLNQRTQTAEV